MATQTGHFSVCPRHCKYAKSFRVIIRPLCISVTFLLSLTHEFTEIKSVAQSHRGNYSTSWTHYQVDFTPSPHSKPLYYYMFLGTLPFWQAIICLAGLSFTYLLLLSALNACDTPRTLDLPLLRATVFVNLIGPMEQYLHSLPILLIKLPKPEITYLYIPGPHWTRGFTITLLI